MRRKDDETLMTVKTGIGLCAARRSSRSTRERFERLWPLTEGRQVVKTRYLVPLDDGLTAEVDVYEGELDGLVTAEVEFPDEATALAFEAPEWLGRDVTDDARYANRTLAVEGFPERRQPGMRIPGRVCRNRRSPSMRRAILAATLAAGLIVTRPGSGLAAGRATVKTRSGSLGTFLVGPNGRTLYLFNERHDHQEHLLRRLRAGVAAAADHGQAEGRREGARLAARDHEAQGRQAAGDLQGPPALLLHP